MAIFDPVTLVKAPENWWGSREELPSGAGRVTDPSLGLARPGRACPAPWPCVAQGLARPCCGGWSRCRAEGPWGNLAPFLGMQ